jgi:hypothetical protein
VAVALATVVRYPHVRPGEGRHPLAVALVGLVVVGGAIGVPRLLAEVSSFDEGTSNTVRAWRVRPAIHASVSQGTRVRAVVTPRLHYVRSIEPVLE